MLKQEAVKMYYGGAITAQGADKLTRFIDMCDTFHLPIVNFVDIPGFMIGVEAEKQATIRFGARYISAVYQATVPWCSVILRRVFGVAGAAHGNHSRLNLRYAWPSGEWGITAHRRRRPGGIQAADRISRRSAGLEGRNRKTLVQENFSVPDSRNVWRRGNYRSTRHTAAALRLGRDGLSLAAESVGS